MKATTVAGLSVVGMVLTGVSVYSLAPAGGGAEIVASDDEDELDEERDEDDEPRRRSSPDHFVTGDDLVLEGRLGHRTLSSGDREETYLFMQVRGQGRGRASTRAPVNLALVIDRSGSMRGERMINAQNAAAAAVSQLSNGDSVSVVTFDTQPTLVVPPTVIGASARSRVIGDIRNIRLGGDTCISCGIEEGLASLSRVEGKVSRMILLSDGDANFGVRDLPGFHALGRRAREREVSITTIGVDLEYNERILTAISAESNGRHYFVEREADLERVFQAEAATLTRTIASQARLNIELAAGVELVRVFDRTFTRSGDRISVPLGSFAQGDEKTVLVSVRLRDPGRSSARADVAEAELTFRDLVKDETDEVSGRLAVRWVDGEGEALDPVVAGRLQRSRTADALKEANELFSQGKVDEAKRRLDASRRQLGEARKTVKKPASAKDEKTIASDFEDQDDALDGAAQAFEPGEPAAPKAKAGAKRSAEDEFDFRL